MEPVNHPYNGNNYPQAALQPVPKLGFFANPIVGFIGSRIATPKSIDNNNNVELEDWVVVDQTKQLKILFSEVSNLIYNEIIEALPEYKDHITVLKPQITDCIDHLIKVIFKKFTENDSNDSNLKINGLDIHPETQGIRFIENQLILIRKHLNSLDNDNEKNKNAFRNLAGELLETAFPGKQADQNLPPLLQSILSGDWKYRLVTWGATSRLTWDSLIEKFAEHGSKLYSSKLNKKVDEKELVNYKGASQFAKDITKLVINRAKEFKNIPFKDLSDESSAFLNEILIKLLREKKPQVETKNDEKKEKNQQEDIVDQTWLWLENTLENAISSILCIIFKPRDGQKNPDVRYHQFVESMASRAINKIPQWDLWEVKIRRILKKDDRTGMSSFRQLENMLGDLKSAKDPKSNTQNSNNQGKISTLTDVLKLNLSSNIKTLTMLLHKEDFHKEVEIFLTDACYSYFAQELLQDELNTKELKETLNLPDFISADKLFTLIYDLIGEYLKEFHDHHKNITEKSKICDQKLAEWNMPELGNLLKEALANLTHILEEKAGDQKDKLIKNYDFLNEIVCHLLKKHSRNIEGMAIAGVKQEALSFIEKIIKIIIVKQIEHAKGEGTVEEAIKKISDNLMAKATESMEHINTNLGFDQATFDHYINEIYEAFKSNKKTPALDLWIMDDSSRIEFAALFSINDTLDPKETDRTIKEKISSDALEFLMAYPEISLEDFKKQLIFDWKIKNETKVIFSIILPEEDFNILLPPKFQGAGIWELVCEKLLSPYLKGIYHQKLISNNYQKLQEPILEGLVDENLPKLKNKIFEHRTNVHELDTILSGLMTQNGLLSMIFDIVAGPIVKSFLAYHVNQKDDGKSSQQLTAELFWNIIHTAWKAFDEAKQNQPDAKNILQEAAKDIMDRVIPQVLWDSHVSEELRTLLKREKIEELILAGLEKGHADYLHLQAMTEHGNKNLDNKAKHLQIPTFLKEQVGKFLTLPKQEEKPRIFSQTPWLNEVICSVLQMNNVSANKPLNQLVESLLFGISDHLIAYALNSDNVLNNLEGKLGEIANLAKPLLDWINQKNWAELNSNITPPEKDRYLKIAGKAEIKDEDDYNELTFWIIARRSLEILLPDETKTWDQIVPEMVRNFLTKDTVAGFLVPILKDIHELRKNLQNSGAEVEDMIGKNDSAAVDNFNQFLNKNVIATIREFVEEMKDDDLDSLPPFVKTLLVKLLSTKNEDIKDLKDRLLKQVVYVVVGQLIDKDNPNSSEKIMGLIQTCIQKYQEQESDLEEQERDLEIATWVFDQAIPNDLWNNMLPELIRDFIERDDIVKLIVPYVAQIRKKVELFEKKKGEAEDFFESIDQKHGIHYLLEQAFYSLDSLIDEYANEKGKIAKTQPLLVNDLIKNAFGDAQTAPMIKDGIRSLVLIALHEALKEREDDPDQTFQERVLELVGKFAEVFKSDEPSLPQLLKVFIPEHLREEILPAFLHNSFTYENIVKWFLKDENKQIEDIKDNLKDYGAVKLDKNFSRLSNWLKGQLASQKMLKDIIFNEKGKINPDIDRFLEITFNEMSKEKHIKSLLGTDFLPYALNEVLTNANNVVLPKGDFNKLAGEMFISALYPGGTKNLKLPELGKKGLVSAVGSVIGSVTNRNERLVFINNFLAPKNDPVAMSKAEALEDQIDKINPPANFDQAAFLKDSETQFKKNVVTFAKSKVDDYVDSKPWPKFFKWLAKIFIKLAVSLVMNISLKHRIWKFISDANNDDLIKKLIWKFLEVTKVYKNEQVPTTTLSHSMQNTFKDHALIPTNFMRKMIGEALGDHIASNNIVDILSS